jgi:hypothetical protein
MIHPLSFMMICDKEYEVYIPYFLLFLSKAYPSYGVHFYSRDPVSSRIKEACEAVGSDKWSIHENAFPEYPNNSFVTKSLRWVIEPKIDWHIYIGDIDMLIFREQPSLFEYHLSRCKETNLHYSNRVRGSASGMRDGEHRLVGLHFVDYFWYRQTAKARAEYAVALASTNLFDKFASNECILYDIAKKSCGLPPADERPVYDYHGIHLGIWRDPARRNPVLLIDNHKYKPQIDKAKFHDYYTQYQSVKRLHEFGIIHGLVPDLDDVFRSMEQFAEVLLCDCSF